MSRKRWYAFLVMILLFQSTVLGNSAKIIETTGKSTSDNTVSLLGGENRNPSGGSGNSLQAISDMKLQHLILLENHGVKEQFKKKRNIDVTHEYNLIPLLLVELSNEEKRQLQNHPLIEGIVPNREIPLPSFSPLGVSDEQGVKPASLESSTAIGAGYLWDEGYEGTDAKIAIIDTGIAHHTEFEGRITNEKSFVKEKYGYHVDLSPTENLHPHGTMVAGVAAGSGKNQKGHGVAPKASIMSARVFPGGEEPTATPAGIIAAIEWVVEQGADVINLSLGGGASWYHDPENLAVNAAVQEGITVVVAAGNEGGTGTWSMSIGTPGSAEEVITVGGTGYDGSGPVPYFSSIGPTVRANVKPDISAPAYVYSTTLDNGYTSTRVSGTSFSAPHVTGAAALFVEYLAENGITTDTPGIIKSAFMKTAEPVTSSGKRFEDIYAGTGVINLTRAYNLLNTYSERPELFAITPSHIPIGLTNVSKSFYPYYQTLFMGQTLCFNFTVASSYNTTLHVNYYGNITTALEIHSMASVDASASTTLWEFNVTLKNVGEEYYLGGINFTDGAKFVEVPMEFYLREPEVTVLWDMKHTSWMNDFIYGQYRHLYQKLVDLNASVDVWHYSASTSPQTLLDPNKYDLVFMPDTASYYPVWSNNGTVIGRNTTGFSREDITAFKNYVKTGGYLLLVAMGRESTNHTHLNKVSRHFGIEFTGWLSHEEVTLHPTKEATGHVLTKGVNKISYRGGELNLRTPMPLPIAKHRGHPVMAFSQFINGGVLAMASNFMFDNERFEHPGYKESSSNLIKNMVQLANRGSTYVHNISGTPLTLQLEENITVTINVTASASQVTGVASDDLGMYSFSVNHPGESCLHVLQPRIKGNLWLGANLTFPDGWILGYSNRTLTVQHVDTKPPTVRAKITNPDYTNGSTKNWTFEALNLRFYVHDDHRLNYNPPCEALVTLESITTFDAEKININDTTWLVNITLPNASIRETLHDYDGFVKVSIVALDHALNEVQSSLTLWLKDPTSPSLSILTPTEGKQFPKDTKEVEVIWNGSDIESGIAYYEVRLDSKEWHKVRETGVANYTFNNVSSGTHEVTIKAVNRMELKTSISVSFLIEAEEVSDLEPLLIRVIIGIGVGVSVIVLIYWVIRKHRE